MASHCPRFCVSRAAAIQMASPRDHRVWNGLNARWTGCRSRSDAGAFPLKLDQQQQQQREDV